MKQITVLSGKGGVGKSSITASLAVVLAEMRHVVCADCDVDAANLGLVLGLQETDYNEWEPLSTNERAVIDYDKCTRCMNCVDQCYFSAIGTEPDNKAERKLQKKKAKEQRPYIKQFGCEGCGVCELVCPHDAISLESVTNASIGHGMSRFGFPVASAQLQMGQSGSGKVVSEVRRLAVELGQKRDSIALLQSDQEVVMLNDAAAGIGCPVIASVVGSDYIIAVTEPTPSGFADMQRALQVVEHFNIPYGIVINKFDINTELTSEIEIFAGQQHAPILTRLPYNRAFLDALVNMVPVVEYESGMRSYFEEIRDALFPKKK